MTLTGLGVATLGTAAYAAAGAGGGSLMSFDPYPCCGGETDDPDPIMCGLIAGPESCDGNSECAHLPETPYCCSNGCDS